MSPINNTPLNHYAISHAGRRAILHPELGREIQAQTAVRYLRFLRPVRVACLELPLVSYGRWVPTVPTHPAHVLVSVLDRASNRWRVIADVALPPNPKCAGEGLSQEMPIEEMEAHFRKVMAEQIPHRIELGGIETDLLRVECDREHPVWPNHGECNGGPYHVPFGILQNLSAVGEDLGVVAAPPYRRKLSRGGFTPAAPEGMTLDTRNPLEVVFSGDRLRVGFSLIRPMLTRLDWNHFGDRQPDGNRLFFKGSWGGGDALGGQNGPSYITAAGNCVPQNMSGTVEVTGNQVKYLGIATGAGVTVNAVFTVTAEALTVALEQEAETDLPVIEGEAWRLLWNMRAGLTGVAALPQDREGRNGFVELPALIAADSGGCLAVRLIEGAGAFHTESYRFSEARSTGFVLATPDAPDAPLVIPQGNRRAVFELRPCALLPVPAAQESALSEGMIVCRTLSGNSGTYRWSSNAMDVIGFGHIDAYVNAWSFRGLKNAAALCARLGDDQLAARCAEAAAALAANYARQLVNPETGWVSGWRSRDGRLHDYGFLWINGVACAFGVMDQAANRRALANLEAKRRELFPESGYPGLPLNLLPITPEDHMLPRLGYQTKPTYENYTDGALSPLTATYYLRALSRNGLAAEARAIADSLEQGFADGLFHGPYGSGKEFMTWNGADSGYEGTFGPNSGPLYAIAVERGVVTPPDPEWWPAEGEKQ